MKWNRNSNDKYYKCGYNNCNKSYTTKFNLQNHFKTHENDNIILNIRSTNLTLCHTNLTIGPKSLEMSHLQMIQSNESVMKINLTDIPCKIFSKMITNYYSNESRKNKIPMNNYIVPPLDCYKK